MIVMKSYHRGFLYPRPGKKLNVCALNKRNHKVHGREAEFPFTLSMTSSLTRATRPTPTLRNARSNPARAGPSHGRAGKRPHQARRSGKPLPSDCGGCGWFLQGEALRPIGVHVRRSAAQAESGEAKK